MLNTDSILKLKLIVMLSRNLEINSERLFDRSIGHLKQKIFF